MSEITSAARLAVLNLMPRAETYCNYIRDIVPTGTSITFMRVRNHRYTSSDHEALTATHIFYDDVDASRFDALIVSGSPLDRQPAFDMATYWNELTGIVLDAREKVGSIAGICWGAQAIGKIVYGLEKQVFGQKLLGVYRLACLDRNHLLTHNWGESYWCPQSRYAAFEERGLARLIAKGVLKALDWSEHTGYCSVVSSDCRIVMLQGHFDYPTERLALEYRWATEKGQPLSVPVNYDLTNPVNYWRESSCLLLGSWLKLSTLLKRNHCICT